METFSSPLAVTGIFFGRSTWMREYWPHQIGMVWFVIVYGVHPSGLGSYSIWPQASLVLDCL
ncbi:hypothetical protein RB213_006448 [Colletotrichum asianum]